MQKIKLVILLVCMAFISYADAQVNDKTGRKITSSQANGDEVIKMNEKMFLENIFNYKKEKEWKYAGNKPAVIDFYADWCGPCRKITSTIKELAKLYKNEIIVYKVDTDEEKELAKAMGIRSLPTIVFIPLDGKPQVIMGAANKETFHRAVNKVLLNQ